MLQPSKQLLAERALEMTFLDALPEHIAVLDADGVIVGANEAWRRFAEANGATDPSHYMGVNYIQLCQDSSGITNTGSKELANAMEAVISRRIDSYVHHYSCHAPTEERWFQVRVVPCDHPVARAMVIHEKITETALSARAYDAWVEEIKRQNRAQSLGIMAAELAHELNQPLAAISCFASGALRRISEKPLTPEQTTDVLAQILEQANRMSRLFNSIRDAVRGESTRRRDIQLEAFLEAFANSMAPRLLRDNASLIIDASVRDLVVSAEPSAFEQVLMNLVNNAIEACSEAKSPVRQIRVLAKTKDSRVLITVRDTGPGITTDAKSDLLHTFFSTKKEGLGLGLSICRKVVELHGGSLVVENGDTGAAFTFDLPAAEKTR